MAVGDALGLPVQFKKRDSYKIDGMIGNGTFNMPEGSWSDDTSLTIATCESIKQCGCVDAEDIRKNFEAWLIDGKFTPFGRAYDIGGTCDKAITSGKGCTDEWSNGNGSLMRIIPLAFVDRITDEEIAEVSAITHAHARAKDGCVTYVRIARGLLNGRNLKISIMNSISEDSAYARCRYIETLSREDIKSSGYVVDTLEAALWCLLSTNSFEECLLKAVNLGGDTDSIGAVAGGLAGIIYGIDAVPDDWINKLQAKSVIKECLF